MKSLPVVVKENTKSRIAEAFKITLQTLKAANPDVNLNELHIGQILYLPISSLDVQLGSKAIPSLDDTSSSRNAEPSDTWEESNTTNGSLLTKAEKKTLKFHNEALITLCEACGIPRPKLKWNTALSLEAQTYALHPIDIYTLKRSCIEREGECTHRVTQLYQCVEQVPPINGAPWNCGASQRSLQNAAQLRINIGKRTYHGEPFDGRHVRLTKNIWPTTTDIGMGMASGNFARVVVGRYRESGNIGGQSPYSGAIQPSSIHVPNLDGASCSSKPAGPSNEYATTDGSRLNRDQMKALELHNKARARVSTISGVPRPQLKWNPGLAAGAQVYAQHLMETGSFMHADTEGESENLAKFSLCTYYGYQATDGTFLHADTHSGSLVNAVKVWCRFGKKYHGERIMGKLQGTFPWATLIWPTTTEVGMGIAEGNLGAVVVARYKEPGKMFGRSAWSGA